MSSELQHFVTLDPDQKVQAMRRLRLTGMSDHGIAAATRMAVEQVQGLLRERPGATAGVLATRETP